MTHEELLAKLNSHAHYPYGCNDCACGDEFEGFEHHLNKVAIKQTNALRNIVELHKPMNHYILEDYCEKCSHVASDIYVLYPCDTILAVNKELE